MKKKKVGQTSNVLKPKWTLLKNYKKKCKLCRLPGYIQNQLQVRSPLCIRVKEKGKGNTCDEDDTN